MSDPVHPEPPHQDQQTEADVERLSKELKDQVRNARERIGDRYAKLVEDRSIEVPEVEP